MKILKNKTDHNGVSIRSVQLKPELDIVDPLHVFASTLQSPPATKLSPELLSRICDYVAQARSAGLSPAAIRKQLGLKHAVGQKSTGHQHVKGKGSIGANPMILARDSGIPDRNLVPLGMMVRHGPRLPPATQLAPGSRLVREWNGQVHEVIVQSDCSFLWNGKVHRSLSQIAIAITGTVWSGPRFFGTRVRDGAVRTGKRQASDIAETQQPARHVGSYPPKPRGERLSGQPRKVRDA